MRNQHPNELISPSLFLHLLDPSKLLNYFSSLLDLILLLRPFPSEGRNEGLLGSEDMWAPNSDFGHC